MSTLAFVLGAGLVGGTVLLVRGRSVRLSSAETSSDNTPQSNVNTSETPIGVSDDDSATGVDGSITTISAPDPSQPDQTTTLVNDGLGLVQPSGTSGGPSTGGDPSGTTGTGASAPAPFNAGGLGIASSTPVQPPANLMTVVHGAGASFSRPNINATYRSYGAVTGALW